MRQQGRRPPSTRVRGWRLSPEFRLSVFPHVPWMAAPAGNRSSVLELEERLRRRLVEGPRTVSLEVALRHFDLADDPEEKRIHLLAATRYIAAQKVMKGILWSTENAERLQRGDLLSEREDDD